MMSHELIEIFSLVFGTGFVVCLLVLVYDAVFSDRRAMRARITELGSGQNDQDSISLFKSIRINNGELSSIRMRGIDSLVRLLEQAGVQCSPAGLLGWSVGCGLTLAAAGAVRAWWLAIALALPGACLPLLTLYLRRNARQQKMSRQLPEVFDMISRSVKSGQTVPASLQIIAEDFAQPIASEFALCYEQQNLGMSREAALRKLADRTGIMELQIFVVALVVQSRSGGNLVELLGNLAMMVRKRLRLQNRVKSLTGEGRMQAIVLFLLPFVVFLALYFLAPDYSAPLLKRPFVLTATLIAQSVGVLWIRRIIKIQY